MKIQTPTGANIPLAEVANLKEMQGSVTLLRENQQPQMNVTSEVVDRDLAGVVKDVEAELEKMNLPEGYSYHIGGEGGEKTGIIPDISQALGLARFLVSRL